jgi:cell fate (sporulation/competence/biofilm development) regulator YlbF (YheA/YmcA/DUF963 family)
MKLFITTALISLAAAQPSNRIDSGIQYVSNNNPIDAKNINFLTNFAKELGNRFEKQAQQYGVDVDLSELGNGLAQEYKAQANDIDDFLTEQENVAEEMGNQQLNAIKQSETYKQAEQNYKLVEETVKTGTLGGVLMKSFNKLNKNLDEIEDAGLRKHMKDILKQSTRAAGKQIKAQGFKPNQKIQNVIETSGADFIKENAKYYTNQGNQILAEKLKKLGKN